MPIRPENRCLYPKDWGKLVDDFAKWYEGELYEDYYGEF